MLATSRITKLRSLSLRSWLLMCGLGLTLQATLPAADTLAMLRNAGINVHPGDDLEGKIIPSLKRFIIEKDGIYARRPKNSKLDYDYESESMRSVDEILDDLPAPSCAVIARGFAKFMMDLGVPADDIRIVDTVGVLEYKQVCSTAGQSWHAGFSYPEEAIEKRRIGASGHVFILVRIGSQWKLLTPYNHPKPGLGITSYISPPAMRQRMARGPLILPKEASAAPDRAFQARHQSSPYTPGLLVMGVWKPTEYPQHTFVQRVNMAASGQLDNPICRFDPKKIPPPLPLAATEGEPHAGKGVRLERLPDPEPAAHTAP